MKGVTIMANKTNIGFPNISMKSHQVIILSNCNIFFLNWDYVVNFLNQCNWGYFIITSLKIQINPNTIYQKQKSTLMHARTINYVEAHIIVGSSRSNNN